jgi:hypothetical protein
MTVWPDVWSLDVSVWPGSIQVLLYSRGRERLEGQGRAALSNQGLPWKTGQGSGCPTSSHPRAVN